MVAHFDFVFGQPVGFMLLMYYFYLLVCLPSVVSDWVDFEAIHFVWTLNVESLTSLLRVRFLNDFSKVEAQDGVAEASSPS